MTQTRLIVMTTVLRQRVITRPDILPAIRIIRRASYGTPLVALVLAGRGIVETRVVIRMAIGKNSQRAVGVVVLVAAEEVIHACCAGGAAGVGIWARVPCGSNMPYCLVCTLFRR